MVEIRLKTKKLIIFYIILILIFELIPSTIDTIADSNPPIDKGSGRWETMEGQDWTVNNSTGNFWVGKNITVYDSIQIQSGGVLIFQNCTVIVSKSIVVSNNGSLTLINSTLKFNGTANGTSELQALPGGSVYIRDYDNNSLTTSDNSIITSNLTDNRHRYLFTIFPNANFSMRNSELHQCGYSITSPDRYGPYILSSNSIIENNSISNNFAGLVIQCSNTTIKNNKFSNNEEYGCIMAMCDNNRIQNNTFTNNKYNFGLILDSLNPKHNITPDNDIEGKSVYYFENTSDQNVLTQDSAGFIGIINSTNITISNQNLNSNYESIFILGGDKTIIQNTNLTENLYGAVLNKAKNVVFENCNIFNNSNLGMRLMNSQVAIINSTINESISYDFEIRNNSYVQIINSSFNSSNVQIFDQNSYFEVQLFLHIMTKNHQGTPIGNVTIEIFDGNDEYVKNVTTNASGFTNWIPCTSYTIFNSGINRTMSNHKLYVKYSGIEFTQYVNMTQSKSVVMLLNHAPGITNKPPKLIYLDEETRFYYDFNYTDSDFDNVTWHYSSNADWITSIGYNTGIINNTPSDSDLGIFYLNISCNDSYKGSDYYNFTIKVNNTNDPPEIIEKQNIGIAREDILYLHDFNVSDPDPFDNHVWYLNTNASWLNSINPYIGLIYGTPLQEDIGLYFVNLSCRDKAKVFDIYNFTVTVLPMNDKPIILNKENKTVPVLEESIYHHDFDYFDEDLDTVTWHLITNASWLDNINTSTGVITGTPHDFDVGAFFVNVSCIDSNNSIAYQNYTIIVLNSNDPPSFLDPGVNTLYAQEDEYFKFSFDVFDPDFGDMFSYSLYSEILTSSRSPVGPGSRAAWLDITLSSNTRSCTIFGTPDNDDVGTILVNLTCTDLLGFSDNISFYIRVNNTNDAPRISNPANNPSYVLEDFEFYHDFNYEDIDGDTVNWSIITDAKWLLDINSKSGVLTGIPLQEHIGEYFVEVSCFDPLNGSDSQLFTIKVNNTNDPPMISNPNPESNYIYENEYYEYDFNSIDVDSKQTFWKSETNASWLNKIDRFTGIINGTPFDINIGEFYVNITCSDEHSASSYWNYTLIVYNTNDPPLVSNGYLAPGIVDINELYYYKFNYLDIDGDKVTWEIETNGSLWLNFEPSQAVLSGTPNRLNIGSYYVNISCKDPYGGIGFYLYTIHVQGSRNRAPELFDGYVTPTSGDIDTIFTFYVTYRDLDSDPALSVVIKINDAPHTMELLEGNDVYVGVVYTFQTALPEGVTTCYFQATDSLSKRANVIDNSTPSNRNPKLITVKQKEESGILKFLQDNAIFIIVLLILLYIIVASAAYVRRRRIRAKDDAEEQKEVSAKDATSKTAVEEFDLDAPDDDMLFDDELDLDSDEPVSDEEELIEDEEPIKDLEEPLEDIDEEIEEPVTDIEVEPDSEPDEELEPELDSEPELEDEPDLETESEPEIEDEAGVEELTKKEYKEKVEDEGQHELMICPQCGEFVNETFESCPGCGVSFVFDEQDPEPDLESPDELDESVEDEIEPTIESEDNEDIEEYPIE
jgi:parallel beta-helix repeat protein